MSKEAIVFFDQTHQKWQRTYETPGKFVTYHDTEAEASRGLNPYIIDSTGNLKRFNDPVTPVMDNNLQATDIKGYRVLNEVDKALMNGLKEVESSLMNSLNGMKENKEINQRSLALAITNLQQGFMWANRAIARPNGE